MNAELDYESGLKNYMPVFIIGSERSGTNLLRAILQSHTQIASPPPAGFVGVLGSVLREHEISSPPTLLKILEEAILISKIHHNPWDIDLDVKSILAKLPNSRGIYFWDIFRALNEIYCENKRCGVWLSKEPYLHRYIHELNRNFQRAKFLYIVRDGRDVAASMIRGRLHEFHVYDAARSWARDQKFCLEAMSSKLVFNQMLLIKYECLIRNPIEEINRIMNFLEIDFQSSQLKFYENIDVVEHSMKSKLWKNLGKPLTANSIGSYRHYFTDSEVNLFETIAGPELLALGYENDTPMNHKINSQSILRFRVLSALRRRIFGLDLTGEGRRVRVRNRVFKEIIARTRGLVRKA